MPINEISVQELKRRLDAGERLQVLDVREPWEYAIAHLPGSVLIPLGQLAGRVQELSAESDIIAMCKSGGRSRKAAELLAAAGINRVANLTGGINAWTEEIDPTLASY